MASKVLLWAALAALVTASAPGAFAEHGQLGNGTTEVYPFNFNAFTFFQEVDWVGVGGSGGDSTIENDMHATPDDCADSDGEGQFVWGNLHYAVPSIAQRILHQEEAVIVPGQSVAAPGALVDLCTQARQVLFGQEADHTYENDPQQVGFGDVTSTATSFVLPGGSFSNAFVAEPLTIKAPLCTMNLPVTFSSDGQEPYVESPNGVIEGTAASCIELRPGFIDNDELNNGATWEPGTINTYAGNVAAYDIDIFDVFGEGSTELLAGLYALCIQVSVVDANNAAAGFFEDYGWFWIDGPDNGYALADQWLPHTSWDGWSPGQDCSSIGITL